AQTARSLRPPAPSFSTPAAMRERPPRSLVKSHGVYHPEKRTPHPGRGGFVLIHTFCRPFSHVDDPDQSPAPAGPFSFTHAGKTGWGFSPRSLRKGWVSYRHP